jgi:phosphoglycolate phosphatase-like HAD superfamily hydrolase
LKLITILFDIDGTLIRSGGAGLIAIETSLRRMFDVEGIPQVQVHGRTDNGILSDIFAAHRLSFDEHRDEFNARYWSELPETLSRCSGQILPGVEHLLKELAENENVALGLLTGNSQRASDIKLRHFGLAGYFQFGGFGDHHSDRNEVAKLARQSAEAYLGRDFDPCHLWVVGDTVNDIVCARSIDSKVVAVETGGCDPRSLNQARPDLQLGCLSHTEMFLSVVVGEVGNGRSDLV